MEHHHEADEGQAENEHHVGADLETRCVVSVEAKGLASRHSFHCTSSALLGRLARGGRCGGSGSRRGAAPPCSRVGRAAAGRCASTAAGGLGRGHFY